MPAILKWTGWVHFLLVIWFSYISQPTHTCCHFRINESRQPNLSLTLALTLKQMTGFIRLQRKLQSKCWNFFYWININCGSMCAKIWTYGIYHKNFKVFTYHVHRTGRDLLVTALQWKTYYSATLCFCLPTVMHCSDDIASHHLPMLINP